MQIPILGQAEECQEMKIYALLAIPFLANCATVPKAISVDDYCNAVALETEFYAQQRSRLTILDLHYRIEAGLSRYPEKERDKMRDMVEFAYKHFGTPQEVGQGAKEKCLKERADGTWYS